jgi:hypothetical protein
MGYSVSIKKIIIAMTVSLGSFILLEAQINYFNNIFNYNDFSPSLAVTEYQGDFILYGVTDDSLNGTRSAYIANIDSNGILNYWKTISDPVSFYWAGYRGSGLIGMGLSGFVASGAIQHFDRTNAILYRFNPDGDTLWTKQYPDTVNNMWTQFWDCDVTQDNGFIMCGNHTLNSSTVNTLLIRADSLGNELWRKEYGTPGWIKHGYSVVSTPDGGYLIGTYEYIAGQDTTGDPVVIKLDNNGTVEWEINLGGPHRDIAPKVNVANDGNYIVGTSISDSVIGTNFFTRITICKLSQSGDIIWDKKYCKTDHENGLYSLYPDHNGGYVATGKRDDYFNSSGQWWNEYGWLLKIDEQGDSVWYREYQYYSGTGDDYNRLYDLCLASDGGYAMVGQAFTWGAPQVAWVIKVDSIGCDTPDCGQVNILEFPSTQSTSLHNLKIYPNPALGQVTFQYSNFDCPCTMLIFDLYGRLQDEILIPKGEKEFRMDISDYPPGLYQVISKNEHGFVSKGKFVKQ